MKPSEIFRALEAAAFAIGVRVRLDRIPLSSEKRPAGGLCRIHGRAFVLIDAGLPWPDKIAILARALAGFDLRGTTLPDDALALVDRERRRAAAARQNVGPLKPLARTRRGPA